MKKMLALFLAFLSLFSFALADEADVEPMYFLPEAAEAYPGEFFPLDELGLQLYLPAQFYEGGAQPDVGLYNTFYSDDGAAVQISVTDAATLGGGVADLAALYEFLYFSGFLGEASMGLINDVPCVLAESEDIANVAYFTEAGEVILFSFYPISDEALAPVLGLMVSSLMPIPAE